MVEMALSCHHLAYRFLKISGGEPPYPPPPRLAKSCVRACEQVVWWSSGVPHPWWRCFSTIKAISTRTLPPELLCVCPRWKLNCGQNCFLLFICRLCMVVVSKQITLLIHIIIHTNGTIKRITSRIIHWKKNYSPLWCWKNVSVSENMSTKYSSLTKPPPPLEVKWSLPYAVFSYCTLPHIFSLIDNLA